MVSFSRDGSPTEEWTNPRLLDLGKRLGLGIALEAFNDVKTGKGIFVEPELVNPAFFKVFTHLPFELGVTLQEFVALVETKRAEGGKCVENFGFLLGSGRTGGKRPIEFGAPDDKGRG
jgi:hypothetical protein